MQIFHNLEEWQIFRRKLSPSQSLGLVATMGNLHRGHVSLVKQSQKENIHTVVSIFINPKQFNRSDDFTHYPRTLEADLNLLKEQGVDYCLLPTEEMIYPDDYHYRVEEIECSTILEGEQRPGHFRAVLTVVMKLLNLVKPHCAYFGEKDYQQYLLIQNMVAAFFMDIKIKACPTIREASGLAYSSRNNRLTVEERMQAEKFARIFHQKKSIAAIEEELKEQGIVVEYLKNHQLRRFAAIQIGKIRLIDNYELT